MLPTHVAALKPFDPIAVLDRGHVQLMDRMGTDASIAADARASTGRDGQPADAVKDRGLIRRLMRDEHTSPFEMAEVKFHIKAPLSTARQWMRHRTASICEQSARYTEVGFDEFHHTAPDAWRLQSKDNRQGSDGFLPESVEAGLETPGGWNLSRQEKNHVLRSQNIYQLRIENGIAREQARNCLPENRYVQWIWKIDLHNLLHFLRLRLALDAQLEIRQYARAIASIVEQLFPVTWEAFRDYRLEATTWSRMEMEALKAILCPDLLMVGREEILNRIFPGNRERAACREKLAWLGLVAAEGGAA